MKMCVVHCSTWRLLVFFLSGFFLINLTDGAKKDNAAMEPSYAPLEESQGIFSATVVDEQTTAELKEVSFFGHTTIGGIRKENDDSNNRLDLATITEISVVQSNYESVRFRDKEFTLVRVITVNGAVMDNLLVPKHVIICGKDTNGIERSWFLGKIDKLIVSQGDEKREAPEVVVDKVFKEGQANVSGQHQLPESQEVTQKKIDVSVMQQIPAKGSISHQQPIIDSSFVGALKRLADALVDMIKAMWIFIRGLF